MSAFPRPHCLWFVSGVTLASVAPLNAQSPPTIPRVHNLALTQTLHDEGKGDRESVVTLVETSPAGVKYRWSFLEVHTNGDTLRHTWERFVSSADLDTATRWKESYDSNEPLERPG